MCEAVAVESHPGTAEAPRPPEPGGAERPAAGRGDEGAGPRGEPRSLLVVEDEAAALRMLLVLLESAGFEVEGTGSADEALERLGERDFDAVLSDVRMPGKTGLELLGRVRELRPETPVVLMTAYASVDSAVDAMRAGAFDYVTKPFKRDELVLVLERAFERRALERENRRLRRAVEQTSRLGGLIGASAAMRGIFSVIGKVAESRSNVLITGESGTGKEQVARTIHFTGSRAERPFVPVSCSAIPEGLLESELFGHVRGAFTGAVASKTGLFEEAEGGTLFLDEIGEMGPGLQTKLLRAIQEREIRPVGGTRRVPIDVRIVAATNADLDRLLEDGRFRRDLFYRLNVIPIHIPPLRERPEDVKVLAEHFVQKHAGERRRAISPAALARLERMRFDGNARELENAIEFALAMSDHDEIAPGDLPAEPAVPAAPSESPERFVRRVLERGTTLRELEDWIIDEALRWTGGNKVKTAKLLGISRRTLYRRGSARGGAPPVPGAR